MKRRLFFIAVITIFCVSCTGFFDMRDDVKITDFGTVDASGNVISTTHIYFDNTGNRFPVDIFSTHERTVKVNKSLVLPDQCSENVSWLPTKPLEEFYFYLTFYLPVVDNIQVPYIPQGWSSAQINIPFNQTTRVPIINLKNVISNDAILFNDVGIIIENNLPMTVQLLRGPVVLQPENIPLPSINPNQKGFYRVPPANTIAGYSIMTSSAMERNLPSEILSLVPGNVYIIEINSAGQTVFKESFQLTMNRFFD